MSRERERVDLQSFKSKLKLVLKDNSNEYWECLKKFTQAKLTKQELDNYARSVLVTDDNGTPFFDPELAQVALHNLFIKSIFNNAYCPYGPPLPNPSTPTSATNVDIKSWPNASAASKKKKEKKEKKKKRSREAEKPEDRKRSRTEAILYGNRADFSSFNNQLHTKMLNSPSLVALRAKMHKMATEKGLNHVSNETVALVMTATEVWVSLSWSNVLQEFLKRLLAFTRVQNKPQPPLRSIHPPSTSPPPRLHSEIKLITPEDIHHAVVTRPYLLGEDYSVNLEKISMLI